MNDPTMNRAYSVLEVKGIDDERREIEGIATTPETDRMGDIVDSMGAQFKNPLALLWQHRHESPVGQAVFGKATKDGIPFKATIAKIDEPGALKDLLDMAWQSVKAKLVRGVSIGFRSLEAAQMEGGGIRFLASEILELSLVTVPANASATITSIKSIDQQILAASGQKDARVVRLSKPGASGSTTKAASIPKPLEGKTMNVQDQIAAYTAQRAEKAAALDAIVEKSVETGETFDAAQTEEYDTLKGEIETIDKHLARLRDHEKTVAAKAVPVIPNTETPAKSATAARTGDGVIAVAKKLPPGVAFARLSGVIARSKGNIGSALEYARENFPTEKPMHNVLKMMNSNDLETVMKTAVAVGTSVGTTWAQPLVEYQQMADEFIDWLRPQTIIGRIPNLRRVPFNISVPRQTSGGSASWVGEGAPKPVTAFAFDNVTMRFTKLASISVITQELARFSSPNADLLIRDQLAKAIIQQGDADFVDPSNTGTTDVKPASITATSTAIPSTGNDEASVRADIRALFAPFIAANLTPANGVWIMSATTALSLSLMVNALGQPSFPGITMSGGTFWGMPVIVSETAALAGATSGGLVILANASDILLADDGQVTVDASDQASLQMDDDPTNPVVAATVLISLWQQNLLGIRAERFINWTKSRPASVQYLSDVLWGQPSS